MTTRRSTGAQRRRTGARPSRRRKPTAPAEPRALPEPITASMPASAEPGPDLSAAEPDVLESAPERVFAARTPPPAPERPLPSTRRAIFFDVENTSRAAHVARLIDHLAVDRLGQRTDFVAVGNWRVIGIDTARLLAQHGAQLVHAAPSVGVKDWSDLRIAVSAGVWLGTARPGDVLEIVSDDRAFDAVGDVATGLGIAYRRLSNRSLSGAPEPEISAPPQRAAEPAGHRRRGRRRGGRGRAPAPSVSAPAHIAVARRIEPVAPAGAHTKEPHTAPHDEIIAVVRDLIEASPARSTTLDALANALKAHGFSRPPGSPRLITRLRRIKEVAVSRSGTITLSDSAVEDLAPAAVSAGADEDSDWAPIEQGSLLRTGGEGVDAGPTPRRSRRRRRSRRGGRGRGRGEPAATG